VTVNKLSTAKECQSSGQKQTLKKVLHILSQTPWYKNLPARAGKIETSLPSLNTFHIFLFNKAVYNFFFSTLFTFCPQLK